MENSNMINNLCKYNASKKKEGNEEEKIESGVNVVMVSYNRHTKYSNVKVSILR